jgi:hypothetical protein
VFRKLILFFLLPALCAITVFAQPRAFDDIFPDLPPRIKASVFTKSGFINSSERAKGIAIYGAGNNSGIAPQIIDAVMTKNPGYLVESILVIPQQTEASGLLDVYNALGNIRGLKGRLYDSHTKDKAIPLFEDATRLVSENRSTAIPDPPPAQNIPQTETIYIRLKDSNFGNSYYRGEMTLLNNGLLYRMSNYRNLTYFFIPVIREDKFIAQMYFEPVKDGILVYSLAGADVSDFAASRVDMGSAISKRLAVIISWVADGIESSK